MKQHLVQLALIDHFAALVALVEVLVLRFAQLVKISGIHLCAVALRKRAFSIAVGIASICYRVGITKVGIWYSKTTRMRSASKPRFSFVRFKTFPFFVMLDFQPRPFRIVNTVIQRANFCRRQSYGRSRREWLNAIGWAHIAKIQIAKQLYYLFHFVH